MRHVGGGLGPSSERLKTLDSIVAHTSGRPGLPVPPVRTRSSHDYRGIDPKTPNVSSERPLFIPIEGYEMGEWWDLAGPRLAGPKADASLLCRWLVGGVLGRGLGMSSSRPARRAVEALRRPIAGSGGRWRLERLLRACGRRKWGCLPPTAPSPRSAIGAEVVGRSRSIQGLAQFIPSYGYISVVIG